MSSSKNWRCRSFISWSRSSKKNSPFAACSRCQQAAGSKVRASLALMGVSSFPGLGFVICIKPRYTRSLHFYTTTLTPPLDEEDLSPPCVRMAVATYSHKKMEQQESSIHDHHDRL